MKIKKSEFIKLIKEEAVKLYKQKLNENEVVTSPEEPREKHDHEKNVYPEYGENLTKVVSHMREVVTMLQDMKLKQEAHRNVVPKGSNRENQYQKATNVIEKAASAADGFAQKLNKLAIVMLKDLE